MEHLYFYRSVAGFLHHLPQCWIRCDVNRLTTFSLGHTVLQILLHVISFSGDLLDFIYHWMQTSTQQLCDWIMYAVQAIIVKVLCNVWNVFDLWEVYCATQDTHIEGLQIYTSQKKFWTAVNVDGVWRLHVNEKSMFYILLKLNCTFILIQIYLLYLMPTSKSQTFWPMAQSNSKNSTQVQKTVALYAKNCRLITLKNIQTNQHSLLVIGYINPETSVKFIASQIIQRL